MMRSTVYGIEICHAAYGSLCRFDRELQKVGNYSVTTLLVALVGFVIILRCGINPQPSEQGLRDLAT